MIVVIKFSGSLFNGPDTSEIRSIIHTIEKFRKNGYGFVLIVGGGRRSREYIGLGRDLKLNENELDRIGIEATKINARLLVGALGESAYPIVAERLDDAAIALIMNKIAIFGGLIPGHSTNAVGALVAERINADIFINATDVDGVYDKNPKEYARSKLMDVVTINQMKNILQDTEFVAGSYDLMDSVALLVIERSKINTIITKFTATNIEKALNGQKVGTKVIFNE